MSNYECKGCKSAIPHIKDICLYGMSLLPCPCQLCLIKSMCFNSCEEFDKAYQMLDKKEVEKRREFKCV